MHVLAERCSTCVFRPGNLMSLGAGRLKDLLDENLTADSALQCHQTLDYSKEQRPPAVCRGFYDHPRAVESFPLRLARSMDRIVFDNEEEQHG